MTFPKLSGQMKFPRLSGQMIQGLVFALGLGIALAGYWGVRNVRDTATRIENRKISEEHMEDLGFKVKHKGIRKEGLYFAGKSVSTRASQAEAYRSSRLWRKQALSVLGIMVSGFALIGLRGYRPKWE
ncbi:MAG: hypothetical protein M5U13_16475 [Thermoanaerobaculia bacterium]|nr:hypothetical protein [Thermoanaerobaculia bacterium]